MRDDRTVRARDPALDIGANAAPARHLERDAESLEFATGIAFGFVSNARRARNIKEINEGLADRGPPV